MSIEVSRFAACWGEYEEKVQRLVELVAEAEVYPFLKNRGYRFVSGNGTFVVCSSPFDQILSTDLPELKELAKSAPDNPEERTQDEVLALDEEYIAILRILAEQIPGMNQPLGNFMDDYTPVSRRGGS